MRAGSRINVRMVGRQFGYAIRSIRDIVRAPSRARGFVRMLRSLRSSPLDLGLPWLPFSLVDWLETSIRWEDGVKVFEYGGGGSTAWFAERAVMVNTVEHDRAWHESLSQELASRHNVSVAFRPPNDDYAEYIAAIDDFPDEYFDLVVVDGRERVACFLRAIPKVRPGGRLILDDTDRRRYQRAIWSMEWSRTDYVGFAPCKPTLAYTSVFTKPHGPS